MFRVVPNGIWEISIERQRQDTPLGNAIFQPSLVRRYVVECGVSVISTLNGFPRTSLGWCDCGSTLFVYNNTRAGAIWEKYDDMSYRTFAGILDAHKERIESSLPTEFSSDQFIRTAKDYCGDEFTSVLRQTNYRGLNSWIARWYLNSRYEQMGERSISTIMGNNGKNKLWRK